MASLVLGLLMALGLLVSKVRERAGRARHGMENEPTQPPLGKKEIA